MSVWKPMDTAPTDGRWIYVLIATLMVGAGKPWSVSPEIRVLRRERFSPYGQGYWASIHGTSVADSYVAEGLWAELDALPIMEMLERRERWRSEQAGNLFDLPVPFGSGLPL